MTALEPITLTTEAMATYLSVPVSTVHRWVLEGNHPPFRKPGKRRLFLKTDVDAWFQALPVTKGFYPN